MAIVQSKRTNELEDPGASDEVDALWNAVSANAVPIGTITMWGGNDPPPGWKLCRGDFLRRQDYPQLFSVLGYQWGGSVDGSTFQLPNFARLIPVGADDAISRVYKFGSQNSFFTTGTDLPATMAVNFIIKV